MDLVLAESIKTDIAYRVLGMLNFEGTISRLPV